MVTNIQQIGTVVSDTGKLIICDPDFLSLWKENQFVSHKAYQDSLDGKVYTFGIDFKNFNDILFDHKTVNDLVAEKRLVRMLYPESNEFSNKSVNEGIINKGYSQCNFDDGRSGMALAVSTYAGDGEFPVFAELEDGQLTKLWIDFTKNVE